MNNYKTIFSYVIASGIFGVNCFLPFNSVPKSFGTLQIGINYEYNTIISLNY